MKKLFDMELMQRDELLMENTGRGDILLSATRGGEFWGEQLRGRVMPLGVCTTCTPDSSRNYIDAPLVLETDDGTRLLMRLSAYLHLEKTLEDKLIHGEEVSPEEYYYKGTARFDSGAEDYKWMEDRVFVCDGIICDWSLLKFSVYEV